MSRGHGGVAEYHCQGIRKGRMGRQEYEDGRLTIAVGNQEISDHCRTHTTKRWHRQFIHLSMILYFRDYTH